MTHFGIITPPVPGHVHPFGALGRELQRRGHRVTVFHMLDLETLVHAQQLEFQSVGQSDHPMGSLPQSLAALGKRSGLSALRFTVHAIRRTTEMFCRDAPNALRASGVEALLVDQTEPAGAVVADHLGIPYVTLCMALPLHREAGIPPPFSHADYSTRIGSRLSHRMGQVIWDGFTSPVHQVLQAYRRQWGLRRYPARDAAFSSLAQISQLVAGFDFPRHHLPPQFHYTGPLRDSLPAVSFPWERLDGRPLIYASLGTLQGSKITIFRKIAEACLDLSVQLVISHGNALSLEAIRTLPGAPLVVPYAPQRELLGRAALTITHAGLNTVLDSLGHGVPLIAIPLTYEQPGIAARARACGTAEIVRFAHLKAHNLRATMVHIMGQTTYRTAAVRIADEIKRAGGTSRAATIIEAAIRTRQPVTRIEEA